MVPPRVTLKNIMELSRRSASTATIGTSIYAMNFTLSFPGSFWDLRLAMLQKWILLPVRILNKHPHYIYIDSFQDVVHD